MPSSISPCEGTVILTEDAPGFRSGAVSIEIAEGTFCAPVVPTTSKTKHTVFRNMRTSVATEARPTRWVVWREIGSAHHLDSLTRDGGTVLQRTDLSSTRWAVALPAHGQGRVLDGPE